MNQYRNEENESTDKMKNITISIPVIQIEVLSDLEKKGLICSRSDGIRIAVKEFLEKEIYNLNLMNRDIGIQGIVKLKPNTSKK